MEKEERKLGGMIGAILPMLPGAGCAERVGRSGDPRPMGTGREWVGATVHGRAIGGAPPSETALPVCECVSV